MPVNKQQTSLFLLLLFCLRVCFVRLHVCLRQQKLTEAFGFDLTLKCFKIEDRTFAHEASKRCKEANVFFQLKIVDKNLKVVRVRDVAVTHFKCCRQRCRRTF